MSYRKIRNTAPKETKFAFRPKDLLSRQLAPDAWIVKQTEDYRYHPEGVCWQNMKESVKTEKGFMMWICGAPAKRFRSPGSGKVYYFCEVHRHGFLPPLEEVKEEE